MQLMAKKALRMFWEMFTGKFLLGQVRALRAGGISPSRDASQGGQGGQKSPGEHAHAH